jgi:Asp/Glu/hydantoin racemase
MRIWEQGLVATYSLPGYKELILEHYDAFKRPDTVIEVHGVRDVANQTAARIAGKAVQFSYLQRFHDTQVIENVRRAEREGFDAVIIGAMQDPGLAVARTVVDIPVLGYGEVSLLVACMHGSRSGFIAINPDMDPTLRQMIRDYGMEARTAPIAYMDCGYSDLHDAVNGKPERFLSAFKAASQKTMREHGVDVLLPGQTIITELLWRAGIKELDGALVLDPRLPLLRMAEMLVDMRKAGFGVSRRGFNWAKPPKDLEKGVRDFYASPE